MLTIEEIQAELQEEIDLCNKYFIEEDIHKESTEHERLALKIVMMCMQTLSVLKDGELEDYKHIKQWKSDVMDGFCRYDASIFEELVANVGNKGIDDFATKICEILEKYQTGFNMVSMANIWHFSKELAEQLKAGVENES